MSDIQVKKQSHLSLQYMAIVAMLAAVSTIAYYLIEVPIIPFAPHLKVNFADIPALLGGIILGPAATVIITFLRCVIHLFKTSTAGIGELVDFMVGCSMMIPMIIIYKKLVSSYKAKAYIIGSVIAVVTAIIGGLLANLLLYPVFMYLILGVGIESFEVFMAYLGSTIVMNLVRALVTVLLTAVFLPFIGVIKKAAAIN